jgi:anaerobic selenocysteine-containing dehydrogenase
LQNKLADYAEGVPLKPDWKADPREFLRRYPHWFKFNGILNKEPYKAVANNFAILSSMVLTGGKQKGFDLHSSEKDWTERYKGWVKAAFDSADLKKWIAVNPYAFQSLSIRDVDLIWFKNPTGTYRVAIQVPAYAFLMDRFQGGNWYARIHGIKLTLKGQRPTTMIPLAFFNGGSRATSLSDGFVGLVVTVQGVEAPEAI